MRVGLTFEAGGDPAPADAILAALAGAGVLATFFLDGRWAEGHPELVRSIAAAGHELGNHGYRHPDWTTLTDDEIEEDLASTERLAQALAQRTVRPWARPPFGACDDRVLGVLERAGYRAFYRDAVDGAHWPGETTEASIHARALQSASAGEPVVLHTNRAETARALPGIVAALRRRGDEPVPLSALGSTPSPRPRRHPDFDGLEIRPGYVRPRAPGRWHSLNLLELGAALSRPEGTTEHVAELGGTACELVTGGADPVDWAPDAEDRRVLVLAGGLRCDVGELGHLVARPGDFYLCPAGTGARLTSLDGRRFVAVVWRAA
jgi:peptidoglycan/xylan/chitin deacetylase (PgdA/CDA1 family)